MLYADASALLKLYLDEADADFTRDLLSRDPAWVTVCVAAVQVRRNFARLLTGDDLAHARAEFAKDWSQVLSLTVDDVTCDRAAVLAEATGVRSLDAVHLEAAERTGAGLGVPIATFDRRLADAARSLGWSVLGA